MEEVIGSIGSFLWGPPMIIAIIGCGLLLTVKSKFFVFRNIGHIFKNTLGTMTEKDSAAKEKKKGAYPHSKQFVLLLEERLVLDL